MASRVQHIRGNRTAHKSVQAGNGMRAVGRSPLPDADRRRIDRATRTANSLHASAEEFIARNGRAQSRTACTKARTYCRRCMRASQNGSFTVTSVRWARRGAGGQPAPLPQAVHFACARRQQRKRVTDIGREPPDCRVRGAGVTRLVSREKTSRLRSCSTTRPVTPDTKYQSFLIL